jgi:cytoskeletal protein RodZ
MGGLDLVSHLKRRLRSLLVALAVLALSTGAVLAGRGSHPAAPPQTSGPEAADQGDQNEQGDQNAGGEDAETPDAPDTEAPETEAPETKAPETQAPETQAPDAGGAPTQHPDNHGKLVSEAAQADTPSGFDSHGAYVRTVARQNHGADASAKGKATSAAAKAKHPKSN